MAHGYNLNKQQDDSAVEIKCYAEKGYIPQLRL